MGRKIVCPDCGSIVDEDILKAKNSENTCLICGANLGGDSINKAEEHADWITWYYYGFKSGDGKSATLDVYKRQILCSEIFQFREDRSKTQYRATYTWAGQYRLQFFGVCKNAYETAYTKRDDVHVPN